MTRKRNVSVYHEKDMMDGIRRYQEREDLPYFATAVSKLLKNALRAENLLKGAGK